MMDGTQKAWDPRDLVYGLTAILRHIGVDLLVDYSKTVSEVYEDATFAIT
jgi:hypothetical protein